MPNETILLRTATYVDRELSSLFLIKRYAVWVLNSYLASSCFCGLITSANSWDPDQDLIPNCFDTLIVFLKEFLKKSQQMTKAWKITQQAELAESMVLNGSILYYLAIFP